MSGLLRTRALGCWCLRFFLPSVWSSFFRGKQVAVQSVRQSLCVILNIAWNTAYIFPPYITLYLHDVLIEEPP